MDNANGYEECAEVFLRARNHRIGPEVIGDWVHELAPDSTVLELGCGNGVISEALLEAKASLYAIDASPTLLCVFRERFPTVVVECADVNNSTFFNRSFDGIVAWGLLFLLAEDAQRALLVKVARALVTGGRLVFTAPSAAVTWNDALTGLESRSLGADEYVSILTRAGLTVQPGRTDIGANYYYLQQSPVPERRRVVHL